MPVRLGRNPAPDEMLTMRPNFWRFMCGAAACEHQKAPCTFASNRTSQSCSLTSSMGFATCPRTPPAQLTRMSMPPRAFAISSKTRPTAARSARSRVRVALAPDSAAMRRPASSRSSAQTWAPSAARDCTMLRPMPCAAPVTATRRLAKSSFMASASRRVWTRIVRVARPRCRGSG